MSTLITGADAGFIYCARCKTRNSHDARRCVRCDHPFGEKLTDAAKFELSKPAPLPGARTMTPQPGAARVYYPPVKANIEILPGRPGCVSIYALALLVGAVVALVLAHRPVGNLSWQESITLTYMSGAAASVAPLWGLALFIVITVVGLWGMHRWGRLLNLLLLLVLFILLVAAVVTQVTMTSDWTIASLAIGWLPWFALTLYAWRWFYVNSRRFESRAH